ncbi:MAG: hypothetical protein C4539_04345 [Ignavibacteriales bacterium]|nr:MAG: hypothetical protein C4539_04345 [Ignavibacteriales bacterium]
MNKSIYVKFLIIILITIFSISLAQQNKDETIPPVPREMRATWVATVANIDWPSRPGLSVDEQQKEIIAIIDRVAELNLNTIVLQVRPQADAFYKSDLEPWSYYLTGQQGKAPEPFYDPLEFWISESHKKGIELHAWLNPYRAKHSAMRGEDAPNSVLVTKPGCAKKLGNAGFYWLDPAQKEVQDHSYNVVMDIVKRYDIDAIHFDDYFYPYPEYNDGKDFPDDDTYEAYKKSGGNMERGDWRRDAVNKFIERVYNGIKNEKSWVKFGISPFGVYRPGYPSSIGGGFDQYATLYADAKLWLNKGWLDYYVPQLYWNISRVDLSYPVLLEWWQSENTLKRNLWPGLFIRPEVNGRTMALEIVNQVMVTRGIVPNSKGNMFFSMKSLMPKDSLTGRMLLEGPYRNKALIPSYSWLDKIPPAIPEIKTDKNSEEIKISWTTGGSEKPFLYVLYSKQGERWIYEILPGEKLEAVLPLDKKVTLIAIGAVDKCSNESRSEILSVE